MGRSVGYIPSRGIERFHVPSRWRWCSNCGQPIMLDDKQKRIRVIVPNLMGYDPDSMPATYHAFFDPSAGAQAPDDGRPVHEGLHPDFVMPDPA